MLATSSCSSSGSAPRLSTDSHSVSTRSRTVFIDFSSKTVDDFVVIESLVAFTATKVMFDVSSDAFSR